MHEKRSSPRLPITARVMLAGSDEVAYHFTRDLSLTGLFLMREEPLALGVEISLELAIQGLDRLIKVRAKVVRWQDKAPKGLGLHFVTMDPADRTQLARFLS